MRYLIAGLLMTAGLWAQAWETADKLPDVDFAGLSATQKAAALKMLREQDCNCGCNLKIAQCRVKDPNCGYSKMLANGTVAEFKAGKSVDQAYATLRELQKKGPVRPKVLEDAVKLNVKGAPGKGPESAKVTIVEFSDFQCPYCALAAPKAVAVAAQYPKDVRLVFKQFPLDMHANAHLAAQAALAAAAQGKFWELHDRMFGDYRRLSRPNLERMAADAGLDVKAFAADLDSGKYKATVDREMKEGEAAGVMGTPTFFINGKRYNGPFEMEALKPILDAELKGAK